MAHITSDITPGNGALRADRWVSDISAPIYDLWECLDVPVDKRMMVQEVITGAITVGASVFILSDPVNR